MTEEQLHRLEEDYESALSALDELQQEHPTISFEKLRVKLDAIGTVLTGHAIAMDEPDEPVM